jgi:hypothetical protein
MNVVTDKIERQVKAGRQVMDRTFHVVEEQVAPVVSTRRAQVTSAILIVSMVAIGVGVLAYRRRRRRTLASRLQDVLPEQLVRNRAVKRALG